jgi:hypothetical protein
MSGYNLQEYFGLPHKPKVAGGVMLDGQQVTESVQCVHCSGHYYPQPGSGKRRGWCMNCQGPICGELLCDTCIPIEARLEGWETGKTKAQVLQGLNKAAHRTVL